MEENKDKKGGGKGFKYHRNRRKNFHHKQNAKAKDADKPLNNTPAPEVLGESELEVESREVMSESQTFEPYETDKDAKVGYQGGFGGQEVEESQKVEIIGVRFKDVGKIYYFAPGDIQVQKGQAVIVETARGVEYSTVAVPNSFVDEKTIVKPLKPIVRLASADDTRRHENNLRLEKEALEICEKKIAEHKLEMKLVDVEYTFDNNKLIFYFTADGRVDFRELVKDLATVFKTRIELRQIGIRDEAKLLGGLGICGRVFCCNSFLSDFAQVSIKMAKDQNLSLNSAKISGTCGRLICCLKYENDVYEEEIKKTPPVDSIVRCKDGDEGVVIDTSPLAGLIKVRLTDKNDTVIKLISRDDVEVIGKMKKGEAAKKEQKEEQK